NVNQIRYLVISHTGANPALPLDRLAKVHIAAGYPGIVYDFVVDGVGQIFRTKELETTAQPDQAWSEQGVNIGLAGNFGNAPPPLAQIDATGRLCAWLSQNLGLTPEAIRGLGELTRKDSPWDNPGATFYRGPAWKEMIQRQVQLHLAALGMGAVDTGRLDELVAQLDVLKVDNNALREQLRNNESEQERVQRFNERLQAELGARQRELDALRQDAGNLKLRIVDDTSSLPRDARRYRPRRPETVRYFVIHHTGVDPATSLLDLATAQRREWPGILFDYVIDVHGGIHQTQPTDEVIATAEPYLSQAIGVALAGNFESAIPTNEQIHAGGQLLAWLMERFPQVTPERILGVNEFTAASTSPGAQWLTGKRWKDRLLASLRRASGMIDPSEVENELRTTVQVLEGKLEQSERMAQALQEVRSRLEVDNQQLQADLQQRSSQPTAVYVVPQPAVRNIVEQLPHHPTLRYDRRSLSQITHIAIHHTATPPTVSPLRIAELHIAPDPARGKDPWPGIGYHYMVHADGSIEQTNPLEAASFHVYRHHGYSVGVCFSGSFMNGKIPTSAQLRAGAHLVAWLMQELNVPLARVWGHRDFPENTTVCPGSEWTQGNRWRDLLFERIEQVQSGAAIKLIRHYLLLWQRPFPGPMARQDLVNAVGYLARFRPAVGFSADEAKNAEYVTILGNEAGISAVTERMLLDSGCKVERIAGRDDGETAHLLAEMVRTGRRFRAYDVDF
ncbi:MAG: N-acetylmuramoyl-L-alanine amidase, partial [Caldilineaceae bacterium]